MNREDSTREELFADPDEIVAFAQAYYSTEFPNNARSGCPSADALRQAARSDTLPDARLRAHLFICSECFRSFRSARISHSPLAVATQPRPRSLRAAFAVPPAPRRALVRAAGAVSLTVLVAAAAVFVWRARPEPTDVATNEPPREVAAALAPGEPVKVEPATSAPVVKEKMERRHAPGRAKRAVQAARNKQGWQVITINLQEDNLQRAADQVGSKPQSIHLAPRRQRLRLRLPEGSASGRYTVSLVDAFGKPLVTSSALSDGRTLTVDLDLRGLTTKKYRLCLTRSAESPDCYLVNVSEQTTRAVR
jgi:hypothetical protein